MTTDTSEKGLETLIMRHMTGTDGLTVPPNMAAERPPAYGGTGYTAGSPQDYDRAHALDVREAALLLPDEAPLEIVEDDAELAEALDGEDEEAVA